MRTAGTFALLAGTICVLGCSNEPAGPPTAESPDAVADAAPDVPGTADLADTSSEQPAVPDLGEWLQPPEGLSSGLTDSYLAVIEAVKAGQPGAEVQLSESSANIASVLMRQGKTEMAYDFFAQAGMSLRRAMKSSSSPIADGMAGSIFYNEACALALDGQTDAAINALADAVENGFSNMNLLASDSDLASVRATEGFDDMLADWKRLAKEKVIEQAKEELAAGETFPFTFASTDIDGNPQSLDALKGNVVIVDVWGTWCPPCRAEIPSFIKLQETYGDQGFQMIGLNYEREGNDEENLQAVVDYVAENGINYPCVMGDEETRDLIPDFRGYPTTLFIDRTGTVRMKAVGLHDYEYLDAVVSTLLAE
jgi:thiol-disulfide isomerase/thioredoxin